MGNPAINALIECPFFIEQELNYITCESPIKCTKNKFVFSSKRDKDNHIKKVCCVNGGKKCLHYRTMMILYERGVLNGVPD